MADAALLEGVDGRGERLRGGAVVLEEEDLLYAPGTEDSSGVDESPPRGAPLSEGEGGKAASPLLISVLIALAIFFSVTAAVSKKFMYDAYGDRTVFFRQILTNGLYDMWASTVVVYKLLWTDDIPRSMRKRHRIMPFAVIALCDSFADTLASVGGVNTPGSWQTLLQQLTIPAVMLVSFFTLRARFGGVQVAGASTIVLGAALAIVPTLTAGDTRKNGHVRWYSVLIYAVSQFPTATSSVLKEKAFRRGALDVFYLTTVVSWIQLGLTWMWAPLLSLPGFGGVPLREVPSTFREGFYCFIGHDDVPVYSLGKVIGHCSPFVTRITFMFSLSGFFAGVLQLFITKYSSAVLTVLVTAVALPLANLAFSVPFVMGADSVEPFSWWDVGGLAVVLAGLALYRSVQIRAAYARMSASRRSPGASVHAAAAAPRSAEA